MWFIYLCCGTALYDDAQAVSHLFPIASLNIKLSSKTNWITSDKSLMKYCQTCYIGLLLHCQGQLDRRLFLFSNSQKRKWRFNFVWQFIVTTKSILTAVAVIGIFLERGSSETKVAYIWCKWSWTRDKSFNQTFRQNQDISVRLLYMELIHRS